MPGTGPGTGRAFLRRLALAAAAGMFGFSCLAGGLWLHGIRWVTVRTPSMAQAAPVGTLLITEPLGRAPLRPGDFVVFRPPTVPGVSYAHRVVSVTADGRVRTKGDLNDSADSWTLHRDDIDGRVVARFRGVGWLLRALPLLLTGALTVVAGCRYWLRPSARLPAGILGGCLLLALTVAWLRPLARAEVLTMRADAGTEQASLVSTGLLPIRARADGATPVDLGPGQKGMLWTHRSPDGGALHVSIAPHLGPALWLLLACCWLLPLAVLVTVGTAGPASREPRAAHRALSRRTHHRAGRHRLSS